MEQKRLRVITVCFLFALLTGLFLPKAAYAGKKAVYTSLIHDTKMVKIRVPNGNFLSDKMNYSLRYHSEKDRWAVLTTLFFSEGEEENVKFERLKTLKVGKKYLIEYRLKGLCGAVTILCTEKYRPFFEKLKEKDFKIGKKVYAVWGSALSAERIKAEGFRIAEPENTEVVERAKKLSDRFLLSDPYKTGDKLPLKRQKAGLLFADLLRDHDIDTAAINQALLYEKYGLGYHLVKYERAKDVAYLAFASGKKVIPLLLVKTKEVLEGEDTIAVYYLKKPLK